MHDPFRPVWYYLPEEDLLRGLCSAIYYKDQYDFYLHSSWEESVIPRHSDGCIYKSWSHISSDLLNWKPHTDNLERAQAGKFFIFKDKFIIIFPNPGGASCFATNHSKELETWEFNPK